LRTAQPAPFGDQPFDWTDFAAYTGAGLASGALAGATFGASLAAGSAIGTAAGVTSAAGTAAIATASTLVGGAAAGTVGGFSNSVLRQGSASLMNTGSVDVNWGQVGTETGWGAAGGLAGAGLGLGLSKLGGALSNSADDIAAAINRGLGRISPSLVTAEGRVFSSAPAISASWVRGVGTFLAGAPSGQFAVAGSQLAMFSSRSGKGEYNDVGGVGPATSQGARGLGRKPTAPTPGDVGGGKGPLHHIATNKNSVAAVRGGPWTPRFEAIFRKAGKSLEWGLNKIRVPGHSGPHPEAYHQAVFDRLVQATKGLRGAAYERELSRELRTIRAEIVRPGSVFYRLLTEG